LTGRGALLAALYRRWAVRTWDEIDRSVTLQMKDLSAYTHAYQARSQRKVRRCGASAVRTVAVAHVDIVPILERASGQSRNWVGAPAADLLSAVCQRLYSIWWPTKRQGRGISLRDSGDVLP